MSSVPGSAITIAESEITIDAEWLASRLGLSAASLRSEMHKGIVYSVVETGLSEGVARTRLPFRYRSRVWNVVVDPDGNLVESIPDVSKALPANTDRLSLTEVVRSSS